LRPLTSPDCPEAYYSSQYNPSVAGSYLAL